MTFRLTLDGDPGMIIRALKYLLKRLRRDYGIKCSAIEAT